MRVELELKLPWSFKEFRVEFPYKTLLISYKIFLKEFTLRINLSIKLTFLNPKSKNKTVKLMKY